MVVISFRSPRFYLTGLLASAGIVFIVILLVQISACTRPVSSAAPEESFIERHRSFLKSYGWEIEGDMPVEKTQVTVPAVFDRTYEEYNALQLSQGFDLTPYRGKQVDKFVYRIGNYPGVTDGSVQATLLVFHGNVIAGDICSVRLDGFMHGFRKTEHLNN